MSTVNYHTLKKVKLYSFHFFLVHYKGTKIVFGVISGPSVLKSILDVILVYLGFIYSGVIFNPRVKESMQPLFQPVWMLMCSRLTGITLPKTQWAG